jgi:hypothetical protein
MDVPLFVARQTSTELEDTATEMTGGAWEGLCRSKVLRFAGSQRTDESGGVYFFSIHGFGVSF